jgi:hypothetical protein
LLAAGGAASNRRGRAKTIEKRAITSEPPGIWFSGRAGCGIVGADIICHRRELSCLRHPQHAARPPRHSRVSAASDAQWRNSGSHKRRRHSPVAPSRFTSRQPQSHQSSNERAASKRVSVGQRLCQAVMSCSRVGERISVIIEWICDGRRLAR